ncbi:MAG: DUF1127 domain-containing protein [Hyphomicrobiaceae bacterium]
MRSTWRPFAIKSLRTSLTKARVWLRRARTRRRLKELDARELADIGLTENERCRECGKSFWQA